MCIVTPPVRLLGGSLVVFSFSIGSYPWRVQVQGPPTRGPASPKLLPSRHHPVSDPDLPEDHVRPGTKHLFCHFSTLQSTYPCPALSFEFTLTVPASGSPSLLATGPLKHSPVALRRAHSSRAAFPVDPVAGGWKTVFPGQSTFD